MRKSHGHSDPIVQEIADAIEEMDRLLPEDGFSEPCEVGRFIESHRDLHRRVSKSTGGMLSKLGLGDKRLKQTGSEFMNRYQSLTEASHKHNADIARSRIKDVKDTIGEVNGKTLDTQQRIAIAMDVRNRLVLAGAGTGKTLTIVGFAKYIILSGHADPDDILFLSFTNAAVDELRSRISKEIGGRANVYTFHRLGLRIIAEADGKTPRVNSSDKNAMLLEIVRGMLSDRRYLSRINRYMAFGNPVDESSFENADDYLRYLHENPLVTMRGERVKSMGEADIANHLAMSGIEYVYEDPYEFDTADAIHGQYHPDFHIAGTSVYIEYFGIDRRGSVAPFMVSKDPDASRKYSESMEWKKRIHETNGTVLISLYSYERSEGILLDRLEQELENAGIGRSEVSESRLYAGLSEGSDRMLKKLVAQMSTCITLVKSTGKRFDDAFAHRGGSILERRANDLFLDILRPVYESYEERLRAAGEIDFEDMLVRAAERIREGKWTNPYGYVVVDEYQDISRSRMSLLSAMRESSDFRLFCVGDDWQSIYRFNGSDVGYIIDFERFWGPSEICRIERTYRFSGDLLRASNGFMTGIPGQMDKALRGDSEKNTGVTKVCGKNEFLCAKAAADTIAGIPEGESILMLGRYRHDVMALKDRRFSWKPDIGGNTFTVTCESCLGRTIRFMTIHGSKGLEADHVFIVNNRTGPGGFPSMKPEAPAIGMLLEGRSDDLSEERRLFYVAMTRARKGLYVMTVDGQESLFARRLFNLPDPKFCPECGKRLTIRSGRHGRFVGCSGYPECRYTRNLLPGEDKGV